MNTTKRKHLSNILKQDLIYAGRRHLSVIRWLVERQNADIHHENLVRLAAMNRAHDVVKYLHERGASIEEDVLEQVARHGGDIDMMQWLVERGARLRDRATKFAAKGGQVKALQWLLGRGCELSSEAIYSAIEHDEVETIKYLYDNGYVLPIPEHVDEAAKHGSVAVLDWFSKTFAADLFDWDLLDAHAGLYLVKCNKHKVKEWIRMNRPKE
jgi:hypothetical protein